MHAKTKYKSKLKERNELEITADPQVSVFKKWTKFSVHMARTKKKLKCETSILEVYGSQDKEISIWLGFHMLFFHRNLAFFDKFKDF